MGRAFAEIAFTPTVRAAQTKHGSRRANERLESADGAQDALGEAEREFIAERDGFYQATVSESGWPYVQFRGGPAGFLKVIDARTIGYADFRGNVQYVSVGNLGANPKVALILMDHANRRRLKIWGEARVVEPDDDPGLIRSLTMPDYRARVERAILIDIRAYDWNCPQHITRRFTEEQVRLAMAPVIAELDELRAQVGEAWFVNRRKGPGHTPE